MISRPFLSIGTLALFFLSSSAWAFDTPANDGFVTDEIGLLDPAQEESLEMTLTEYSQQTSNEIAVLVVKSLTGTTITDAGVQVFRDERWRLGDEQKNNGLLILIAYDQNEIGITTGYGLEGAVPDIVAYGVIQRDIVPRFRDGEYYEGILAGIDALKKHIGGEYTADRYEQSEEDAGAFAWVFFILFVAADWFAALFARTKSWWLGGVFGGVFGIIFTALYSWWISIPALVLIGLLFDYIVSQKGYTRSRGPWRGGPGGFGGSGRSGGSGFGGFGGGSTGGGGAHGRW